MAQANVYGQYRQVQISTASPGKLILMLYQGAIKALKKAIELIDRKEFGEKGDQLIKAQDIIMELNLALDMKTGDIALSLNQIYLYAYRKLVLANLEVDKDAIQEVIGLLENLYEAWEVAVQSTEGTMPTASPSPDGQTQRDGVMAMETGQELIKRLTRQQGQYLALKDAVTRQAGHIRGMNVGGLTTDMAEIRSLMRKVRDLEADLRPLRQSWHSLGLDRNPSERRAVDTLVDSIRDAVEEIQTAKGENETLLKDRMGDLRKEMSGVQTQGRAALAYQGPKQANRASQTPKFIDRVTS